MRTSLPKTIGNGNMCLGVVPIESLQFDTGCRSNMIKVLAGLQFIYTNAPLCDEILSLVESEVNPEGQASNTNGRPGMDYWPILVLASVRLGCNLEYDALHDLTSQHRALRIMLGVNEWSNNPDDAELFTWRSIRDNVCKLSPSTITEISNLIVSAGHEIVPDAAEVVRGDSFVVKTNIHYPIDRRQLGDGIRKIIEICASISGVSEISGWRKYRVLLKQNSSLLKALSMASRSGGKGRKAALRNAYNKYFTFVDMIIIRALETMEHVGELMLENNQLSSIYSDLVYYLSATEYMRQLTVRRISDEDVIKNCEKLHSIFEPHTELINRGKQPQAIEFGHRVLVIEDGAGFICHHEVMDIGMLDKDVLCSAMKSLQKRLGNKIRSASFDCGFHTKQNQKDLSMIVKQPCLPAKGAKQGKQQRENASVAFHQARGNHPGIESAIHGLQSGNGLDCCRDKGYLGYERYVALGVLGRNLCTLGRIVIERSSPKSQAAYTKRKAIKF